MRNSLVGLYQLFLFAPLRRAFVISFALHGLLAWSFVLITLSRPPANIIVNLQFNESSNEISDIDKMNIPARQTVTRSRSDWGPVRNPSRPATAGTGTNQQPGADVPAMGCLGDAVSDPGGISVAEGASVGIGLPSKTGGGMGNGQGAGPSVGRSGQGGVAPVVTARPPVIPPIVIPLSIRGSSASHEGAVYYEVDVYILFAPGMRFGVPIPANEICQEGSRIRTIQPIETIEKKTDIAKCQILDYGDDRREECLAGAHSVARSTYHLSSAVNYSVNSCLVYDRSNCEWRDEGDAATGRFANRPVPTTASGLRTRSFNIAVLSRKANRTVTRCTTKFAFYGTSNIKTVPSPGVCYFESRDRSCPASNFILSVFRSTLACKSFFSTLNEQSSCRSKTNSPASGKQSRLGKNKFF